MNRKEAVIYLMENPKAKLRMTKFRGVGDRETNNYVYMADGNIRFSTHMIDSVFSIWIKDDKSEFEVVRELKKMSFTDAIDEIIYTDKKMKSLLDNNYYYMNNQLNDFSMELISGLWTVEGVYND